MALIFSGIIQDIYATRYAELASSTIIIFDHLLTLDDEIELIWNSSWSIGKLLFFINRYYTLACVVVNNYALFGNPNESFCHHLFQWQGWTGLIACMIAETILQMRLYALYFLDKKVLIGMVATFLVTSTTAATILGIALSKLESTANFIPGFSFCIPFNVPDYFYTFWIPILTFECLLCALALARGYQSFRTNGSPFQSGKRLVGILVRDSIIYFTVMFATYLTCLLVWVMNIELLEIPIGFSIAMSCVLGNRVIINVRQANRELGNKKSQVQKAVGSIQAASSIKKSSVFHVPNCDTLTDIEMAQLRSLRSEVEVEGSLVVV